MTNSTSVVTDSNNGLGSIKVHDEVRVIGTPTNDGFYYATAVAAGSITVKPGVLDQSAGTAYTVEVP